MHINKKSFLNEAVFVFAVQSSFFLKLKFLTHTLGFYMVDRLKHGSGNNARPKHDCQPKALGFDMVGRPKELEPDMVTRFKAFGPCIVAILKTLEPIMIAKPKALESWMVARPMILVGLAFLPAWVWRGCGNQAKPKVLKCRE